MSGRCRSTLAPLPADGFSSAALRRLMGSRRRMPVRLGFTRAEVIRYRGEVADRMSISGVQDKLSLRVVDGELVPTERDGEFILKPIPGTPLPRFTDQVPANEHLTMQIADQVFGIDTAANALLELGDGEPAYLTRRFDRRDGQRLDMEDFCALAEQSPETHGRNFKYIGSYEGVGRLMRTFCPAYPVEVEKFFARVVFNYAIGNGDAHLKNFSLLTSPDGDPVLTPAYDLVNTNLHLPHESPLALDLFAGDYMTPAFQALGFHGASDFLLLAERLGMMTARATRIVQAFTDPRTTEAADALVRRSFLSTEAQDLYLAVLQDRRRALGQTYPAT
jgi:serine/threonine-protein kinase HipA